MVMNTSGILCQLTNCFILRDHKIVKEDLWIRDGILCDPEKLFYDEKVRADIKWDCDGMLLAPGFIDVQVNGAFGIDFSSMLNNYKENVAKISQGLLAHGVTSFCPTFVSSSESTYNEVLPYIKKANGGKEGACILGVHLEGPFINIAKKGAHCACHVTDFRHGFSDVVDVYHHLSDVAIVTLAPEHEHSLTVIKELVARGIVVSVGHSEANLEQGELAVREGGATFITHLFNAMLPFHHRDPHLVGLLTSFRLNNRPIFYGLIADGIHTHPTAMRIAHRVNPAGLCLVTDANAAMGMGDGKHVLGGLTIDVSNNQAIISGTNNFAGSVATMNQCLKTFYESTGCTKEQALEAASLHPAQLLHLAPFKGTLNYNSHADLVMLDNDLNVLNTVIKGEVVWSHQNSKLRVDVKL